MLRYRYILSILCSLLAPAVYAGSGLFIHIYNYSGQAISTSVSDVHCMYGADRLNNWALMNGQSVNQYIETRNSGGCALEYHPHFHLTLNSASGKNSLIVFKDNPNSSTPPDTNFSVEGKNTNSTGDVDYFGWHSASIQIDLSSGKQQHVYIYMLMDSNVNVQPIHTP